MTIANWRHGVRVGVAFTWSIVFLCIFTRASAPITQTSSRVSIALSLIPSHPMLYIHSPSDMLMTSPSSAHACSFIHSPNPASPLSQPSHISYPTTHPLRTNPLLHMSQVLPAHRVPALHVLLHAVRIARRFRGREGGAGFGDAALEAVFVEFLLRSVNG